MPSKPKPKSPAKARPVWIVQQKMFNGKWASVNAWDTRYEAKGQLSYREKFGDGMEYRVMKYLPVE